MVDYAFEDLYYQDSVDKQLKIEVENGAVITNEDIFSESMKLTESLCSDTNLSFGSCEASEFEIKIANQFYSMKGMWLDVSEVLNGNEDDPFVFGRYKVESDRPTADRAFREIIAYDAMYDIINADATKIAEWYEGILPELDSTVTLKEFRDSFFELFDIEQEDIVLPNDDMIIEKTVSTASLSGKEVINAICELNGCFGHIGRDNKFHYIFLHEIGDKDIAYAIAVDDNTFFVDASDEKGIGAPYTEDVAFATDIEKENWQSIDYEDYVTHTISSLQLRDSTEDVGYIFDLGSGGNNYIVDGNFLLYGKSSEELHDIARNIYNKISVISYRPTDATLRGNPCLEVGDPIKLVSKYQTIYTYILTRTLSGIQALKDNYSSTGDETYDNSYNSISYEIEQLKGMTNSFERKVESNTLKIESIDGQVSSIEQKIDSISLTVTGGLGGTASISLTVGDEAITGNLNLSNVREAFAEEDSSITIAAGQINIVGNIFTVDSYNFVMTADGTISATDVTLSGTITTTSGSYRTELSGGQFYVYYNDELYGRIVPIYSSGEPRYYSILANADYNVSISIGYGASGYIFVNGGNNPNGYSERVQLAGTTRITGSLYCRNIYTNRYSIYVNDNCGFGSWNSGEDMGFGGGDICTAEKCALIVGNTKYSGSGLDLMLEVTGDAYISGVVYEGSDVAIKSDIKQLDVGTTEDILDTIEPIEFTYNDDDEKKIHFGVTYQNIRESLQAGGLDPDKYAIITKATREKGHEDSHDSDNLNQVNSTIDGEEIGAVAYTELIAPMIYEIKRLKAEVSELKEGKQNE